MRRKTHQEYVDEIIDFSIEVIEEYINARTPILHRCKKCGHEWGVSPSNILQGYGCPLCAGVLKYTASDFIQALLKVNPQIQVVGEYINAHTKIKCRCLIDGHEWDVIPRTLLQGHGCPVCAGNKKKTHDEYVCDVLRINPDIEVLGQYISADTHILHKCKIDGCEWFAKPNNILSGKGCPDCHISIGEKLVSVYLNEHNVHFEAQHTFTGCKNVKLLPFDFYLPEYNVCIEYDGIQHFEPRELFGGQKAFEERVKCDKIKTTYCLSHNIPLLRIKYDENITDVLDKFFCDIQLTKEAI